MRVAVLQSNYLPWKGYFDIIHSVDEFIFYDDVQYTKNDWRNRNRIKTLQGVQWLTVPTGADLDRRIDEVELTNAHWQAKHWKSLQQSYGRCLHFGRYREFFEDVYLGRTWTNLSELNRYLITRIAGDFLQTATRFRSSIEFALSGQRSDRLLDLVHQSGATHYISGPSARSYMDLAAFADVGITVEFFDYAGYPEYPQLYPPFEHAVSIVDLLFHAGHEAPRFIWGWRSEAASGQPYP